MSTDYNGWKNKATWNVALEIGNNEGMYRAACQFMRKYNGRAPYAAFIRSHGMEDDRTTDGFKFASTRVCYRELNEMMKELV